MPFSQAKFDEVFGLGTFTKGTQAAELLVYVTYAGNPNTNLTPAFIGQWCFDSTNAKFYIATSLANTGWKDTTN